MYAEFTISMYAEFHNRLTGDMRLLYFPDFLLHLEKNAHKSKIIRSIINSNERHFKSGSISNQCKFAAI